MYQIKLGSRFQIIPCKHLDLQKWTHGHALAQVQMVIFVMAVSASLVPIPVKRRFCTMSPSISLLPCTFLYNLLPITFSVLFALFYNGYALPSPPANAHVCYVVPQSLLASFLLSLSLSPPSHSLFPPPCSLPISFNVLLLQHCVVG